MAVQRNLLKAKNSKKRNSYSFERIPFLLWGVNIFVNSNFYLAAITSISIEASFGKRATSIQERAGLCSVKYCP